MIEDTLAKKLEKRCSRCLMAKPFDQFNKCKRASYGLHNHCRECQREVKKQWDDKNKEWINQYKELNPEVVKKCAANTKKKYQSDLEYRKSILAKNRIRRREEKVKIKARIQRHKWLKIPQNKIAQSLRRRIREALRGIMKSASTESLTGCSFIQLKEYLESKFQPGMTWDNYGQWHIDHIKPCAYFDLTKEANQKECFHYTNLQPLWATENIAKGAKLLYIK